MGANTPAALDRIHNAPIDTFAGSTPEARQQLEEKAAAAAVKVGFGHEGLALTTVTKNDLLAVNTPDKLDAWALAFATLGFVAAANGGIVLLMANDSKFVVGSVNREARKLGSASHPLESREPAKWGRFVNYGTPGVEDVGPTAAAILEAMRLDWHAMKFHDKAGRRRAIDKIQRLQRSTSSGDRAEAEHLGGDGAPELYCTCQKPENDENYVGCGRCGGWFHWDCVGYSPGDDDETDEYSCPACKESKAASEGPPTGVEPDPSPSAAAAPDAPPCTCQPHRDGDDDAQVHCGSCNEWFNTCCVGYSSEDCGETDDSYSCPTCKGNAIRVAASEEEYRSKKGPYSLVQLNAMTDRQLMSVLAGYSSYRDDETRTAAIERIRAACPGEYDAGELDDLEDYELMMLDARCTGFANPEVDRPLAIESIMARVQAKARKTGKQSPVTEASLHDLADHQLRHVRDGHAGYRLPGSRAAAIEKIRAACPGEYDAGELDDCEDYELKMLDAQHAGRYRNERSRASAEARLVELAPGRFSKDALKDMTGRALQDAIAGHASAASRRSGKAKVADVVATCTANSYPSDRAGRKLKFILLRPNLGSAGYLAGDWNSKILPAFISAIGMNGSRTTAELEQIAKDFRNRDDMLSMAVGGGGKTLVADRARLRQRGVAESLIAFLDEVLSGVRPPRTGSTDEPMTLATMAYFHEQASAEPQKTKVMRKLYEDGAAAALCNRSHAQFRQFLKGYKARHGGMSFVAAAAAASPTGPRVLQKRATAAPKRGTPHKKPKTNGVTDGVPTKKRKFKAREK